MAAERTLDAALVAELEGMTFARPHKTETRLDNGSIRITSTENTIPADASRVILRQIITKPGIYKIRSLSVTVSD